MKQSVKSFQIRNAKAALTLVVEAINLIDGGTFMVSSEEKEVVRVFDPVGEEEADRCYALLSSIDIIAEEEVVGARREASLLE